MRKFITLNPKTWAYIEKLGNELGFGRASEVIEYIINEYKETKQKEEMLRITRLNDQDEE